MTGRLWQLCHYFPIKCRKYLKSSGPKWGFFDPHLQDWCYHSAYIACLNLCNGIFHAYFAHLSHKLSVYLRLVFLYFLIFLYLDICACIVHIFTFSCLISIFCADLCISVAYLSMQVHLNAYYSSAAQIFQNIKNKCTHTQKKPYT